MKRYEIGEVPSKTFEPNDKIPILIPRSGKIFNGKLILEGTATATGGTTNGTALGEGGLVNLIKWITIRANAARGSRYPSGKIVDCEPRDLLRFSIAEVSKLVVDVRGAACDGSAKAHKVYISIPVYFADVNHMAQKLTALNADKKAYQSLLLTAETGDIGDCFEGNDRNWDFDLKVRWVDERYDIPGDSFPLFQQSHRTLIPASKKDFTDEAFPSDEGRLLYWLLMTEKDKDALTEGILNKVTIDHPLMNFEMTDMDIAEKMVRDGWYDPAQDRTGQYFFDFAQGNAAGGLTLADLRTKFDITMLNASNVDQLHSYVRYVRDIAQFSPTEMVEYAKKD